MIAASYGNGLKKGPDVTPIGESQRTLVLAVFTSRKVRIQTGAPHLEPFLRFTSCRVSSWVSDNNLKQLKKQLGRTLRFRPALQFGKAPYASFPLVTGVPERCPPGSILIVTLDLRRLVVDPGGAGDALRALRLQCLDCAMVGRLSEELSPLDATVLRSRRIQSLLPSARPRAGGTATPQRGALADHEAQKNA